MDFKTIPNERRMEGKEKWGWHMAVVLSKLPFPQECFWCAISSFWGRKSTKMIWHLAIVVGSEQREQGEGDGQCTLWMLTQKVGYRAVPQQELYPALHCCCFLSCWCYPSFTFSFLYPVIISWLFPTPVATNPISGNNEWVPTGGLWMAFSYLCASLPAVPQLELYRSVSGTDSICCSQNYLLSRDCSPSPCKFYLEQRECFIQMEDPKEVTSQSSLKVPVNTFHGKCFIFGRKTHLRMRLILCFQCKFFHNWAAISNSRGTALCAFMGQ